MFEERHEEQKREAAEAKQRDEKLQGESQRQKVDRAGSGSDGVGTCGVPSQNDRSPETVVQSHESSSTKGVRKRHLKTESAYFWCNLKIFSMFSDFVIFTLDLDSEEVKRSRKESKSPKTDVSQTNSDSCEDMKTKDVMIVKQEPLSKVSLCKCLF